MSQFERPRRLEAEIQFRYRSGPVRVINGSWVGTRQGLLRAHGGPSRPPARSEKQTFALVPTNLHFRPNIAIPITKHLHRKADMAHPRNGHRVAAHQWVSPLPRPPAVVLVGHPVPEFDACSPVCLVQSDRAHRVVGRSPPSAERRVGTRRCRRLGSRRQRPPSICAQPTPSVTTSVWPSGLTFQGVRAPGGEGSRWVRVS